jgi:ribosome-associated toxin RatA of RatAB toxin-antitoxin module
MNASADAIWAIVTDCDRYEDTMVRIEAAEKISEDADGIVCRTTVDMPFPLSNLTATTRAKHVVEPGKLYTRTWELIEGDYEINRGMWKLEPWKGDPKRTLVTYELQIVPKISIPDSVRQSAQQRTIPELMENLRKQVQ